MPIMSMTAFGSGVFQTDTHTYRCEVKTLNSRFLDSNIRLPRTLSSFEPAIIKLLKERLKRGKVEVTVDIVSHQPSTKLPELNPTALEHYKNLAKQIKSSLPGVGVKDLSVFEFLRLDGTLEQGQKSSSADELAERHLDNVLKALGDGIDKLIEGRLAEGTTLGKALESILGNIADERVEVTKKTEEINAAITTNYREKIQKILEKMGDVGDQVSKHLPEDRLAMEIAILADKADIAEELTRLESHEQEFLKTLKEGKEIGRKLDFLCQELQREVNTIASKVSNLNVSGHTLSMKQYVERLRQQVQNIE